MYLCCISFVISYFREYMQIMLKWDRSDRLTLNFLSLLTLIAWHLLIRFQKFIFFNWLMNCNSFFVIMSFISFFSQFLIWVLESFARVNDGTFNMWKDEIVYVCFCCSSRWRILKSFIGNFIRIVDNFLCERTVEVFIILHLLEPVTHTDYAVNGGKILSNSIKCNW